VTALFDLMRSLLVLDQSQGGIVVLVAAFDKGEFAVGMCRNRAAIVVRTVPVVVVKKICSINNHGKELVAAVWFSII